MIWRVFIWRYLCLSCLFSLAFVSFWLLRLFDFLALGDCWLFGFGDLLIFLAFRFQTFGFAWLLASTGSSFFSLFVAVDITVCVVVVALWLIDFVACFFFHLGFCGWLALQVLTAFVAFGWCAFYPGLLVYGIYFLLWPSPAFALFCLSASVGGSILSVLFLLIVAVL